MEGCSNYALIIIFNQKYRNLQFRNRFEKKLISNNIEFRRGMSGGGNQIRQPYVKKFFKKKLNPKNFKNSEIVHFYSYYIGNFPSLKKNKIKKICRILNDVN